MQWYSGSYVDGFLGVVKRRVFNARFLCFIICRRFAPELRLSEIVKCHSTLEGIDTKMRIILVNCVSRILRDLSSATALLRLCHVGSLWGQLERLEAEDSEH